MVLPVISLFRKFPRHLSELFACSSVREFARDHAEKAMSWSRRQRPQIRSFAVMCLRRGKLLRRRVADRRPQPLRGRRHRDVADAERLRRQLMQNACIRIEVPLLCENDNDTDRRRSPSVRAILLPPVYHGGLGARTREFSKAARTRGGFRVPDLRSPECRRWWSGLQQWRECMKRPDPNRNAPEISGGGSSR